MIASRCKCGRFLQLLPCIAIGSRVTIFGVFSHSYEMLGCTMLSRAQLDDPTLSWGALFSGVNRAVADESPRPRTGSRGDRRGWLRRTTDAVTDVGSSPRTRHAFRFWPTTKHQYEYSLFITAATSMTSSFSDAITSVRNICHGCGREILINNNHADTVTERIIAPSKGHLLNFSQFTMYNRGLNLIWEGVNDDYVI